MKYTLIAFLLVIPFAMNAQSDEIPYREIPSYPDSYTAETTVARMIDGLGFRYYWATEDLREEDLNFKPSDEARTSFQTLQHIFQMSLGIVRSTRGEAMTRISIDGIEFADLRKMTLENFREASENLKGGAKLDELGYKFENNGNVSEFPFWNLINGQISDCIWHVGQVVTFRRSSGNPFNSKASVFTGTVRD